MAMAGGIKQRTRGAGMADFRIAAQGDRAAVSLAVMGGWAAAVAVVEHWPEAARAVWVAEAAVAARESAAGPAGAAASAGNTPAMAARRNPLLRAAAVAGPLWAERSLRRAAPLHW